MAYVVNDPSPDIAAANLAALTAATGDVQLPRGTLYVSGPVMHTYRNRGLRLLGNETEIKNVAENGHALYVDGATGNFTYAESPRKLAAGQVGFLSHWNGDPSNPHFYRDPGRKRYTGKVPPDSERLTLNALIRRAQIVPDLPAGTDRFPLTLSGKPPAVGAICRISDGAWIDALTFDVRRVIAVEGRTVILDRGVSRDFINAATMFPNEPTRIVYEALTFTANDGPVELKGASHITFRECTFTRSPHHPSNRSFTTPIECAFIDFIRCDFPGRLHFGTSHDCRVLCCDTNWLSGEEDAHHIAVIGGVLAGGKLDAAVGCHSWALQGLNCRLLDSFAYDDWIISDVRMTGGGPLTVRGARTTLIHVTIDGPVSSQATYQGQPLTNDAAKGVSLVDVKATAFALDPTWPTEMIGCVVSEPKVDDQ